MLKKIKAWHIFALVIFGVLIYNIPIKYNIEKTIPAVYWSKDDASILEHTEITISGEMRMYLFKQNRFRGFVKVEGMESTYQENSQAQTLLFDEGTMLLYKGLPMEEWEIAAMYCNQTLSEILIAPKTEEDTEKNAVSYSYTISAPASTREDAVKVAKSVLKETEFFDIRWE